MKISEGRDESCLVLASIDRTTSEDVPFVIEKLMAAGARNVNIVPAIGKKGRTSFLAFIDIPEERYAEVVEAMVCHLYCTGWHRLSSSHEFVVTKSRNVEMTYQVDGVATNLTLPVKIVDGSDGRSIVLLEHDVCLEIYRKHVGARSTKSLFELKLELLHLVKNIMGMEAPLGKQD